MPSCQVRVLDKTRVISSYFGVFDLTCKKSSFLERLSTGEHKEDKRSCEEGETGGLVSELFFLLLFKPLPWWSLYSTSRLHHCCMRSHQGPLSHSWRGWSAYHSPPSATSSSSCFGSSFSFPLTCCFSLGVGTQSSHSSLTLALVLAYTTHSPNAWFFLPALFSYLNTTFSMKSYLPFFQNFKFTTCNIFWPLP